MVARSKRIATSGRCIEIVGASFTEYDERGLVVRNADERTQLEVSLHHYRRNFASLLDGLDEEQARRCSVPSRTTILGLVKHLTFVENVWFNEVITGTPREELGPATPTPRSC